MFEYKICRSSELWNLQLRHSEAFLIIRIIRNALPWLLPRCTSTETFPGPEPIHDDPNLGLCEKEYFGISFSCPFHAYTPTDWIIMQIRLLIFSFFFEILPVQL